MDEQLADQARELGVNVSAAARAGAPGHVGHIGEGLAGPTIIAFGTEEQKKKYLPGIVAGKELWCQGYSEPGAGSDLANVKTNKKEI